MEPTPSIHPFLKSFIDENFKKDQVTLRAGNLVTPQVLLFVKRGGAFNMLPIPHASKFFGSEADKRVLPKVVQAHYFYLHNLNQQLRIPFELLAVVVTCDVYVEEIDDVQFLPNGRRATPFVPRDGLKEALTAHVYLKTDQFMMQWEYTRTEIGMAFDETPEGIPTVHIPGGTRLGALWPAGA